MSGEDRRTLLDALILQRRWTSQECVRHFAVAARELGEPATVSMAQLKRWRRGLLSGLPRPTACRVAEHLFGRPAEELFAMVPPGSLADLAHDDHASGTVSVAPQMFATSAGHAAVPWSDNRTLAQRHPTEPPGSRVPGPPAVVDLEYDPIMSSAHDASDHAAEAGRAIEETTLVQLHAEVTRLAHAYASTPPLVMFAHLRRARDLAYRMLERTRRPAQLADLYLIAGQLSGLMAGVSFDAGHPDAAGEQAMAALTYGQIIDHPTLRGYARATLSMIAFWSGRPGEGASHAQAGLEHAPGGDVAVRLHAVAARSWALAGSRDQAMHALHAAEETATRPSRSGDLDGVGAAGGEFAFGRARQELSAGATLLALGEGEEAAQHARVAVELYESLPSEQRWAGGLHGARADLAAAHVLAADLDAARAVLTPTLGLAPEHRTERVTARMRALRRDVSADRFRGSVQASDLADELEAFTASVISLRAMPSGA